MAAATTVSFVDLARQHASIAAELEEAFRTAVESSAFILGEPVRLFERDWGAYCEAGHAVGVGSGTAALHLALEALGVGPGDEVIAPANTFIATILPVLHLGARVVLVDCREDTATIDVDNVSAALGPRTKAIVPVHLYGQPAELDALLKLAGDAGVAVVEDACQAHGARLGGRRVGALGTIGCFSFYPAKNLGALGDGGAVVTNHAELADRVAQLRDLGQAEKYRHVLPGHNERLDALQAAFLSVKLPHLDAWNAARRRVASSYLEQLADTDLVLPSTTEGSEHVWHLFVVRVRERERFRAALSAAGVATGVHYPTPIHLQPAAARLGYRPGSFPVAEALARECVSLPMFPELTGDEVQRVVGMVRDAAGLA